MYHNLDKTLIVRIQKKTNINMLCDTITRATAEN